MNVYIILKAAHPGALPNGLPGSSVSERLPELLQASFYFENVETSDFGEATTKSLVLFVFRCLFLLCASSSSFVWGGCGFVSCSYIVYTFLGEGRVLDVWGLFCFFMVLTPEESTPGLFMGCPLLVGIRVTLFW